MRTNCVAAHHNTKTHAPVRGCVIASRRGEVSRLRDQVGALTARMQELRRERDRLAAENHRLRCDLDDSLDREAAHALDPRNERLAVVAVAHHRPTGSGALRPALDPAAA